MDLSILREQSLEFHSDADTHIGSETEDDSVKHGLISRAPRQSDVFQCPRTQHPVPKRCNSTVIVLFVLSVILNICLSVALWKRPARPKSRLPPWPLDVYSPADESISYETVTFNDAFHEPTIYAGTSPTADAAWESLYEGLLYLNIPTTQATHLLSPTSAHPRAPELSLLGLDALHQLHCLNHIRKSLYPAIYTSTRDEEGWAVHTTHCVESIRQSLMCSADVSPILFKWDEVKNFTLPDARVTHTCRRWEGVKMWAERHQLSVDLDPRERAEGAPIVGGNDA